ncbi:citrate synthase/methylcitrate synthase [Gorillibacterium massiliense]|uniref:citrate synthase/methylcitrate synthase n=1 Tax=Gorillibacterium massiliense TaxID=1280390 RepID=UPI0004B352B2|nr:citrate synthase/methylcitrate synthase [Gorillibacterium massiliense]
MKTFVSGLEGVIAAETEIGEVNGAEGHLVYRGCWARDLAVERTFEEAAYLLWNGRLPNHKELVAFQNGLASWRKLTPQLKALLDAIPAETPLMSVMMSAIAVSGAGSAAWPPTPDQAMRITAIAPVIIAYRHCVAEGRTWQDVPASIVSEDTDDLLANGHTAHYLHMLMGHEASYAQIKALNAYMILAMEHGLNASTFTARVVSSTESDLYSAVAAAIGAMKGPLHGGAPSGVIDLLEEIGTKDQAEACIRERLERGEKLMGFGHRIYKTRDPRAVALRSICEELAGDDPWLDLARFTEETAIRLLDEYKPGRKLYANVEFYAAAVMRTVQMTPELFTPTFTAARIVGWTAHVLEQSGNNRIIRPQSVYIGPMPDEASA